MTIQTEFAELVRQALYGRAISRDGCFVNNEASEKVRRIGRAILPTIEDIILEDVMESCSKDETENWKKFPGLSDVVVCYFQIVKECDETIRAAKFLALTHGPVFVDSVRAIIQVWNQHIPRVFLQRISEASESPESNERVIALWALDWETEK